MESQPARWDKPNRIYTHEKSELEQVLIVKWMTIFSHIFITISFTYYSSWDRLQKAPTTLRVQEEAGIENGRMDGWPFHIQRGTLKY